MPGKFNTSGVYWHPQSKHRELVPDRLDKDSRIAYTAGLKHKGYVYFGSGLELDVYLKLIDLVPAEAIERQSKAVLIPRTTHNKEISWRTDFKVCNDSLFYQGIKEPLYVEAKGLETDVYKLKLEMFRHFYPRANLVIIKQYTECKLLESLLPAF